LPNAGEQFARSPFQLSATSYGSKENTRCVKQIQNGITTETHPDADIVYYIPNIDATIRLWVNETETRKPLACIETKLSNAKTVQHNAVAWGLAFLGLFGILISVVLFEKGYTFSPSKVAAEVMLLLQYYQSLGLLGKQTDVIHGLDSMLTMVRNDSISYASHR